jgi:hypothetical protein
LTSSGSPRTLLRGDAVTNEPGSAPVVPRVVAWVVLVLMAAAILYTGWIALANFHRIGV